MKKTILRYIRLATLVILTFFWCGCDKYLNEPQDKSSAILSTLGDLQAILDYNTIMNIAARTPEENTDNYYLLDDDWDALPNEEDKRMYIWAESNVFRPGEMRNDWAVLYQQVFNANVVLEEIEMIDRNKDNFMTWDDIKGQALVHRATAFLDVVQIWATAYNRETALSDLGIPIRIKSDFNEPSERSSLYASYEQILSDLSSSINLLPVNSISKSRPSKPAAYGLLARTYLWMGDYEKAGAYADSCLQLENDIIDYNTLNPADDFPVSRHNKEVIFERWVDLGQLMITSRAKIPFSVYSLYNGDDLRRQLFFQEIDGEISFKGFYLGFGGIEAGVATDEMYLTRAESYANQNLINDAMNDLNKLLKNRWQKELFEPLSASSKEEALELIRNERRKQLMFRGHRWMDIKRFNRDGAEISLQRELKGETYVLQANSARFVLPLPEDLEVK